MKRGALLASLVIGLWCVGAVAEDKSAVSAAPRIGYHEPKVDASGRLVPWFSPEPSVAYDHGIRLVWDFWRTMRKCPNGVPYYLQHQVWAPEQDDQRGLGGDQISMALDSWTLLYGYLGDPAVKRNMVEMADYWLANGMASPDLLWGNLPFPYNTQLHSGRYDGDMRGGTGYLQPDKAGSFGHQLVVLYKTTGDRRYLAVATGIANTLAKRVTEGDAENSPWPYRVRATDGAVHSAGSEGKVIRASYTTNWTGTLQLFAELIAMHEGDIADYEKARKITGDWLKKYPLATNKWGPFFEDIPTQDYSDTEINADTMAKFLLENPEWDKNSKKLARGILQWSYETFANHEYEKWGVTAINEQTRYLVPGNSHTSRHASVELLYCEKTGDCSLKQDAIRGLNWATYTVDHDGKNRYIRDDIWLTDGYGDYVRNYLRAMAAAPELAPNDQNHLLRTSSAIQEISYGAGKIRYRKFDANSVEKFKIGVGEPKTAKGGSLTWDAKTRVLTVKSNKNDVELLLGPK